MGHRLIFAAATGIAVVVLACLFASDAGAKIPQTVEERQAAIKGLAWKHGGTFRLDASRTTLQINGKYAVVTGADARTFSEATEGVSAPDNLEAIAIEPKTFAAVILYSFNEGYVRFDDWNNVDSDQMMRDIKDNTAEANKQRIENHVPTMEVVGWKQKPTLDRDTQTVRWSIEGRSANGPVVNAVVLTFGRYGYEKFTWVGEPSQDAEGFLTEMRTGATYDSGAKYSDFKQGDKVAGYSIAALIAAAVGAKVAAKVGLFAVFAVFLKKIGIIIVAAAAAALRYVKKLFGRKDSKPSESNTSMDSGGTPTS